MKRHFSLFPEIPEGRVEIISSVKCRHYGNFIHFDKLSHRVGDIGIDTAGRVSCLGVHTEYIASGENFFDRTDQVDIVGEFSGADRADPGEKPRAAVVTVNVYHVIYLAHFRSHGDQLEVDERHVVTEEHIGRFQSLHADLFHLIFFADKHYL